MVMKPGGNMFTIDRAFSQLTDFFQGFKTNDLTRTAERNGPERNGVVGFIQKMGSNEGP